MNSNLTDNEWVKRVNEIRQMVADVPEVPHTAEEVEYCIDNLGLEFDDEKEFARKEFASKYAITD